MAIKKQYLKSKPECKVTFTAPEEVVGNSNDVSLAGEFNNWEVIKLKKQKTGLYSANISLETGKEYQYKFVIDGDRWENDPDADKFITNEFQGTNSVVSL